MDGRRGKCNWLRGAGDAVADLLGRSWPDKVADWEACRLTQTNFVKAARARCRRRRRHRKHRCRHRFGFPVQLPRLSSFYFPFSGADARLPCFPPLGGSSTLGFLVSPCWLWREGPN